MDAPAGGAQSLPAEPRPFRYSAFISYSRQDSRWARWLHRKLETYRIPQRLRGRHSPVGVLGTRLPPLFRDQDELASSPDLANSIREALAQSATLIVICSPAAAASRWVNEEVRTFVTLGRGASIHCLIVDGEPGAGERECFPPALLGGSSEPLAADLRRGRGQPNEAALKLLAALLGVGYDDLRQREIARRNRRLAILSGVSLSGLVVTSGLAIAALHERNEAIQQRDLARQRTLTAERTVEFVRSMFKVADPSESRGAQITAREILDRGMQQIEHGLNNEPNVRADLGATLGEVYSDLGLYREGQRVIRRTLGREPVQPATLAHHLAALAETENKLGDYAAAVRTNQAALAAARATAGDREALEPALLTALGEAQSLNGDYAAADRSISEALRLDLHRPDPPPLAAVRDREALGMNAFYDGRLAQARLLTSSAVSKRIAFGGETDPQVLDDLNLLGSIAYMQRDYGSAEAYYRRVLRIDDVVLGHDHPDRASTLNNLARLLLERRSFEEARRLLVEASTILLKQRAPTYDEFSFIFANLALAERGLGQNSAAEEDFRKALAAARPHQNRNLAPILTDLADLLCAEGRTAAATPLLAEAAPLMARTYPDDPWRSAWVDNVRGGCALAAGERGAAAALIRQSQPILLARWGAASLYGHAAVARGHLITRSPLQNEAGLARPM